MVKWSGITNFRRGFATPITYEVNGKQYVAIAAGGARGAKAGGWYIAFCFEVKIKLLLHFNCQVIKYAFVSVEIPFR